MTPKNNINIPLEHTRNDSKVCYLGIRCHDVNRSLESIIDVFTYSYISICLYLNMNILKYQNNPNSRNLDTVLTFQSAIATAISISAITIMSKFNF